jgi:hypothetical protein
MVDGEAYVAVKGAGVNAALPVEWRVDDEALEVAVESVERLLDICWRSVKA